MMNIIWKGSFEGHEIAISIFPSLEDNYSYLLYWDNLAIVFDPVEPKALLDTLKENELKLHAIFNTHHHPDHVKGNEELKEKTQCSILGPEDEKIPFLDQGLQDGEEIIVGPMRIQVIATPGHTLTHLIYFFPDLKILFAGDTIFGGGCGKLFEGTPEEMVDSLKKIAALPKNTTLFWGHEYTIKNLSFALSVDPENHDIKARLDHAKSLREAHRPTSPSTLEEELKTNPFLRLNDPSMRRYLHMKDASDVEVFYKIRELRDRYQLAKSD